MVAVTSQFDQLSSCLQSTILFFQQTTLNILPQSTITTKIKQQNYSKAVVSTNSLYSSCVLTLSVTNTSQRLLNFLPSQIATDAVCVLIDLGYTVLSTDCTPVGGESPEWLEVLAHISLLITTLFLIEIPLNLWAFGGQHMNPFGPVPHAGLHAFDTFVILTTFILEVVLRGSERELAGLLVILRLWRLVKLVGGL